MGAWTTMAVRACALILRDSSLAEFDPEALELVLPTGARIGHRSMRLYYKQHLHTEEA